MFHVEYFAKLLKLLFIKNNNSYYPQISIENREFYINIQVITLIRGQIDKF